MDEAWQPIMEVMGRTFDDLLVVGGRGMTGGVSRDALWRQSFQNRTLDFPANAMREDRSGHQLSPVALNLVGMCCGRRPT